MKEFNVLSWNVQGQRYRGTALPFEKILPALSSSTADIICLQEMPDAKSKLLGLPDFDSYHTFISELNKNSDQGTHGYNHNVLLSKYPIITAGDLVFPRFSKKLLAFESAVRADIEIMGVAVRLYICHFMVGGAGMVARLKQIEFILADAADCLSPVIICGDMNVAMPANSLVKKIFKWWHRWPAEDMRLDERKLKVSEKQIFHEKVTKYGFREALDINLPTWSPFRGYGWELFKLKLDWFLVRNIQTVEVKLGDYISDHRSVYVRCRL